MNPTLIIATVLQILAALFMAFVWAAFLRKLDIFSPEKWWKIAVAFAFGCLTPFPILWLHSAYPDLMINMEGPGGILQYYTINVGMVEEGFKFLGFILVFIIFRKWFDEDINFLVYGSAVGLGFATTENCLYFFEYGIHLVYIRGLMCAVGHMTGTALIATLLCIGIKKKSFYVIALPMLGFLIASILHGLYDSVLSLELGIVGHILAIYVFMLEFEIWAQYSNNLLNQSKHYQKNVAVDRDTLQKFLIAAFILAGIIQMIGLMAQEGFEEGLRAHLAMLITESILTIILVARITRHTIVPGHWKKVYPQLPFVRKSSLQTIGNGYSQSSSSFTIRGDEFNEYPFTTRINKLIKLIPFTAKKNNADEVYQCWIIDKVFLGKKKELYYLCELAGEKLNIQNAHPSYFLIKPKLAGTKYYEDWPIIGMISLHYEVDIKDIKPDELRFVRWSIFRDEEKEHYSQTWKEMVF